LERKLDMKVFLVPATVSLLLAASVAPAPDQAATQTPAAQKAPAPSTKPAVPAADLDRLLAPIALYPDQLLAQMLLSATNPGKVGALNEWLASQQLKGSELQDAATKAGFAPSYVALVLFPEVVNAMASNMDATTRIGQTFETNRSAVFDSIQRLRKKAQDVGKLKDSPQQDVETKTTSSGQQVIVIEPSNPQVVYVPQYNPTTVYTQPTTSTVVVHEDNTDEAVAAGLIGFTAGIALGAAIDNNYYYGPYGWHGGGAYMYNDAWDDWYDDREDAREDWYDNREDLAEERSDRAKNAQEQRTERSENRAENRPDAQQQRTERQQNREANPEAQAQRTERQQNRQTNPEAQAQREQRRSDAQSAAGTSSFESRGYSGERSQTERTGTQRSGTKSDAFSNYSSGKSERAASQRGNRSRSSSRSGGGSRRR
jgi:Protein of unknown function (DUF3300)